MPRRIAPAVLLLPVLLLPLLRAAPAAAADFADATGRIVRIPDHVEHVLPAGPPAAVLLEVLAPDLMMGWPEPLSQEARALLAPAAAALPEIPRLTGQEDVFAKIKALKPDLIVDYGTVNPHFIELAKQTQEKTGIPTILLDGSMPQIPHVLHALGVVLGREARGDTLAQFAQAILSLPLPPGQTPKVVYARGADGLTVAAPGTDVTEVFAGLGWHVLAPNGQGTFRQATIDQIRALDPDVLVFADPHMRDVLAKNAAWRAVRAVQQGHAFVAPSLPFGWVEEPPSVNRLLGLAWLGGSEAGTLAAIFNAVFYGHAFTPAQHDNVLAGFAPAQ